MELITWDDGVDDGEIVVEVEVEVEVEAEAEVDMPCRLGHVDILANLSCGFYCGIYCGCASTNKASARVQSASGGCE